MSSATEYLYAVERKYPGLLATREGRIALTRVDPKLFALVYLNHHLKDDSTAQMITFGRQHDDWYAHAVEWVKPPAKPREWRRAYVAPRHSAKSTFWFLIAPMWAAAHGHSKFIAAFGDNAGIAERHLSTFKAELDTNERIRQDFPELARPMLRKGKGTAVSDSRQMIVQENGFIFAAAGIGGTSLGLKVGNRRPDVLIMDDIEPQAESYSLYQMEQRRDTLQNAVLPMNAGARVVVVGTVTMDGSLIHQLVKSVTTTEKPATWITDERFACHYYPALRVNDTGDYESVWPEKWPVAELVSIMHTRGFAIQFQNQPLGADGTMWDQGDIMTTDPGPDVLARCRHLLSIDPAVTSKKVSDATGIALLSHDPIGGRVYVRQVWALRLDPKALRTKVAAILSEFEEVRSLLVETNQGGDIWTEIFTYPGIRYNVVHQTVKKEIRAGWLLNGYQKRQIVHTTALPLLDAELLAFPKGLHDDMLDAVGSGYRALTGAGSTAKAQFGSRTV